MKNPLINKINCTLFCLLLAICLQTNAAFGQSNIKVGPRISLGTTWWNGDDASSNQVFKPGLELGGFLTYSTSRAFGLSVELSYAQKGYRSEVDNSPSLENRVQRLHYVSLPILLKFFLTEDGPIRPKLFVGPQLGYLVKASVDYDDDILANNNKTNTEDFTPFEIGVVAGVGVNIKTNETEWLDINLRYTQGLNNINNNPNTAPANAEYKNAGAWLSIGYGWGI